MLDLRIHPSVYHGSCFDGSSTDQITISAGYRKWTAVRRDSITASHGTCTMPSLQFKETSPSHLHLGISIPRETLAEQDHGKWSLDSHVGHAIALSAEEEATLE